MAHGQKRKVVVMFGVLRGELLPVHCEAGPSFFLASDDGLSRPRPRSKPHGQCPIPMPRSPRVWGPGPGTRGARGGARSALDSPSRHRDETRTQTDLNRSEQIWVDQEVGSLSKLPGAEGEIRGHCPREAAHSKPDCSMDAVLSCRLLLDRGRRSSAISSRFRGMLVPRSAQEGREQREQHCTAPSTQPSRAFGPNAKVHDRPGQRRRGG